MSREKQIEEMAYILDGCCNNIPDNVYETYACSTCKAEQIYNAGYRKQEWISVEERLPEEKVNCLVHYKHAYCDNDGYWVIGLTFYDGNKFVIGKEYKITHWMPLPEPPKMKGGAE